MAEFRLAASGSGIVHAGSLSPVRLNRTKPFIVLLIKPVLFPFCGKRASLGALVRNASETAWKQGPRPDTLKRNAAIIKVDNRRVSCPDKCLQWRLSVRAG